MSSQVIQIKCLLHEGDKGDHQEPEEVREV